MKRMLLSRLPRLAFAPREDLTCPWPRGGGVAATSNSRNLDATGEADHRLRLQLVRLVHYPVAGHREAPAKRVHGPVFGQDS